VTTGPARPSTRRYNAKFRRGVRDVPWITTVFLVAEQGACEACQLASAHYATDALPQTPVPGCTRQRGCSCWFAAVAREPQAPPAAPHPNAGALSPSASTGRPNT
jgi:hypothetical protein